MDIEELRKEKEAFMKTVDIEAIKKENKIFTEEVSKIMKAFNGSYINQYLELILIEKTNAFIRLEDVDSINKLRMKVLVVVCRDCFKTEPFVHYSVNTNFQKNCLKILNKALDTNFSRDDTEIIYQNLGNFINQDLAMKFVESGYDMSLLKE